VFPDAKRPVTARILNLLDLPHLASVCGAPLTDAAAVSRARDDQTR
jgi:hypothetical protein